MHDNIRRDKWLFCVGTYEADPCGCKLEYNIIIIRVMAEGLDNDGTPYYADQQQQFGNDDNDEDVDADADDDGDEDTGGNAEPFLDSSTSPPRPADDDHGCTVVSLEREQTSMLADSASGTNHVDATITAPLQDVTNAADDTMT